MYALIIFFLFANYVNAGGFAGYGGYMMFATPSYGPDHYSSRDLLRMNHDFLQPPAQPLNPSENPSEGTTQIVPQNHEINPENKITQKSDL
jgi:hypothetical protein